MLGLSRRVQGKKPVPKKLLQSFNGGFVRVLPHFFLLPIDIFMKTELTIIPIVHEIYILKTLIKRKRFFNFF